VHLCIARALQDAILGRMQAQPFWTVRVLKPELVAALSFLLITVMVNSWGTTLASTLWADFGLGPVRQYVLDEMNVVLLTLLTTLFGIACYLALERYRRGQEASARAHENVSGLMLSREQLRMLYENSPVPYFLMDDIGNVRDPNKATLRFLGGTTEECELANFYDLLTRDAAGTHATSFLRTKVEHEVPVSKEEVRVRMLSGGERWAQVSIYSLDRHSPIPFKHLVTLVDVTKEKESDQVKTDFLLLASHQLRTPATAVKWYIDYLLHSDLNVTGVVREYLEEIYQGNERMIGLITTLLTVSHIEMGTLAPEYGTVHVDDLIRDVLHELEPDSKKKQLHVEVRTNGDDTLTTDGTMLRIVVHNLLTNAFKYTPQGGRVTVNAHYSSNNGTIAVSDTGYGIPIEEQEKIFTKMFRASNVRKISTTGTGLGLYLTKAFVEKIGGSIEFTSEPEKGTTFTISLPRIALGA
jgi:PAS domain S-box-containing protein